MDTSEKYILMCSKACEIQKNKISKVGWIYGDFYSVDNNVSNFNECDQEGYGDVYWSKSITWLPRQDQLQEIALTSIVGRNWDTLRYVTKKTESKYFSDFDSFEKLWLAFAMQKRFNKVWNEEKQYWTNN